MGFLSNRAYKFRGSLEGLSTAIKEQSNSEKKEKFIEARKDRA